MLNTIKAFSLVLISGIAVGTYGNHRLESIPIMNMAVRGFCAEKGLEYVFVTFIGWYNCRDDAVAKVIQSLDADSAAAFAGMASNQPGGQSPQKKEKKK